MCILLYVKLFWCSGIPYISGQLEVGPSALSICAFCYMWKLFGVLVFHRFMVNWRRGPWYMCILLSVKLFWCSGIWYISGQLEVGPSALSICAFCYMLNVFGVVVFHRFMVNWRRGPWYMCILLSVKLFWCSSIPYISGQLEVGPSALSICAFCSMLNIFGVVVFHRSMVYWKRGALVYVHSAICETYLV